MMQNSSHNSINILYIIIVLLFYMFGHSLKKQAVSVDLTPVNNALTSISNNIGYKNIDDKPIREILFDIRTRIIESGGEDVEAKSEIKMLYDMMFANDKSLYNTIGFVDMPENYPGGEDTLYYIIKRIQYVLGKAIPDSSSEKTVYEMLNTLYNDDLSLKIEELKKYLQTNDDSIYYTVGSTSNPANLGSPDSILGYTMNNYNTLHKQKQMNEKYHDRCVLYINTILCSTRKFLYIDYELYEHNYLVVNILNNYFIKNASPINSFEIHSSINTKDEDQLKGFISQFIYKLDVSSEIDQNRDNESFMIDLLFKTYNDKSEYISFEVKVDDESISFIAAKQDADFEWNGFIVPQKIILPFI